MYFRNYGLQITSRSMLNNFRFREPYEKQDGKWAQGLLKYERQHLYHIY